MKVPTIANTDIDELVQVENEQVVTESRKVAETFGRPHKDVLESIRGILAAENSATRFFYETTYDNRGKQYPMFLMNRDGFSLLVMGFTGAKAMQWKIKYIEAFNEMERQLKEQSVARDSYMIADPVKRALKWAEEEKLRQEQAKEITEMRPKAIFADAVSASKSSILIGDLAKILKGNGIETGQKLLFNYLRENGYLIKTGSSKNMPTQKAMELKLFEVKETTINNPDGSIRVTKTTKVTGKGQQYFINKFLSEKTA